MEKMNAFTVADFVLNESFQQWVHTPTTENDAFWLTFLQENPDKHDVITKAKTIVLALGNDNDAPNTAQMNKVWQGVKTDIQEEKPLKQVIVPLRKTSYWLRIAASVTLLLGVFAWFYFQNISQKIYKTGYGEHTLVNLPDGSVVNLNANSTLKVSDDWTGNNTRQVWLTGEAFFTVTKKPNRGDAKFVVHTNYMDVEVLGTEFNVSHRDTNTHVTLNSGKIKLDVHTQEHTETILMKPGEQISFSTNSLKIDKKEVKAASVSAWTNNRWMLESTPLNEVANRIEHTFGIAVVIKDHQVAHERMTGVIMTNNLDEVLEGIATIYSLKITKEANQIVLDR